MASPSSLNSFNLANSTPSSSGIQFTPANAPLQPEDVEMSSPNSQYYSSVQRSTFDSLKISDNSHTLSKTPGANIPTDLMDPLDIPDNSSLLLSNSLNQNRSSSTSTNNNSNNKKQLSTIELTSALGIQPKPRARRTWTPEEDSQLRTLVAEWGDQRGKNSHWDKISESMDGRTSKDCRKRWFHSLDPTLKRGRWTSDEDRVLIEAHNCYGPSWNRIAQLIPGRTDDQCSKRYNDVLDPNVQNRLRQWTKDEDELLMQMFKQHGTQWKIIAAKMDGRTGLTCRNRWRKLASFSVNKTKKGDSVGSNSGNGNGNGNNNKSGSGNSNRKNSNSNNADLNGLTPETTSGQSSTRSTPGPSSTGPNLSTGSPSKGYTNENISNDDINDNNDNDNNLLSTEPNRSPLSSTFYTDVESHHHIHQQNHTHNHHIQNSSNTMPNRHALNATINQSNAEKLQQLQARLGFGGRGRGLDFNNPLIQGLLQESSKENISQPSFRHANNNMSNPSPHNSNNINNNQIIPNRNGQNQIPPNHNQPVYTTTNTTSHFTFGIDNGNTNNKNNHTSGNGARHSHDGSMGLTSNFGYLGNAAVGSMSNPASFNRQSASSILGKRSRPELDNKGNGDNDRNEEELDGFDSQSLKREDVAAIVQAAKEQGVAIVIHQHNYHNHYHTYNYPETPGMANNNSNSIGNSDIVGGIADGIASVGGGIGSVSGVGEIGDTHMDDVNTIILNERNGLETGIGAYRNNSSNSNNINTDLNIPFGNRGKGTQPTSSISTAVAASSVGSGVTGTRSNVSNSVANSRNSAMNNGVPLLARGSVDLGIGTRLNQNFQMCSNCGTESPHTHNHGTNQPTSVNGVSGVGNVGSGVGSVGVNGVGEVAQPKSTYLQPHPHFKELEQIDMGTDPFSWIPPFGAGSDANGNSGTGDNGNGDRMGHSNAFAYDEIPFNPS